MHMRGTPKTMQSLATYDHVASDVNDGLRRQAARAQAVGISAWDIMLDPGIGFAKTHEQSIELLRELEVLGAPGKRGASGRHESAAQFPLLVGASRKRFIGEITGERDAGNRDWGSVGAAIAASANGAAVVRVHNVKGTRQALQVWEAIKRPG